MIKEERYDKILEIIDEENYTSAVSLSKRLFVSLPTIRRDLAELQKRNLIHRSHGGAKKVNTDHVVMPLDFRRTENTSEKRRVSKEAAKLIRDNNIIFIDASSTAACLAEYVSQKKSVTVVTNSIPLSLALIQKGVKTFCTGGEIQSTSIGYAGYYAEAFLRNFNFDIMFFSCTGINERGTVVDTSNAETMLRKVAAELSRTVVFLCDHTKFSASAPYNVIDTDDIDLIVCNSEAQAVLPSTIPKEKVVFA